MRRMLAATLLAAMSFTGSSSYAAGCVTDYLIEEDPGPEPVLITRNPDGSITVRQPDPQLPDVNEFVVRTALFVDCVV